MSQDIQDPYVNLLLEEMRSGRDERFLDRMLISSVIECRGAERFKIISQAIEDPALKVFYRNLWAAEAKHGHQFVEMVLRYESPETVYPRLKKIVEREAAIIETLEWRASLH